MKRIFTAFMMMLCAACMASAANYLTFTAEEDGSTFSFVNKDNNPDVQYSLDGGVTWIALAEGDTVVLAHKGDKALLRGDNPQGFSKGSSRYSTFRMTGKVAASGSVMSLVDGAGLSTEIPVDYCFYGLFNDCTSLTQAPELPATRLESRCYNRMFSGCTSLTQAPALPATIAKSDCYSRMFYGCTSLTQAPELPATTLASYCYWGMFYGCTSLTQAPELPATRLAGDCYESMFSGCTSLTQAPELPATTLANYCYYSMFSGCTSLTQAPALPATTLANYCYYSMFSGCTSLTQAPELPATTLAKYCYLSMFSGCTSLTQAPELPATTLAGYCYESMFSGCTSLTQAPALPATTLAVECYEDMFSGCINLSELNVSFDDWKPGNARNSCSGWVKDVAPTGTFICPKTLIPAYGISRIPIGWTVKSIVDGDTVDVPINYNYLTFTAEEDGSTFGIETKKYRHSSIVSTLVYPSVQYSLDGGVTWTALVEGDTILLAHKGDKALLRGDNPNGFSESSSYSTFKMTGKVAASGSVMSLIDGIGCSVKIPQFFCCFSGLFENCTSLTQAPALPATTLSDECYAEMFSGCTSLTQAPELPATTLSYECYSFMFSGCTSLTQAPALPATTLADACYNGMFKGCTGLTQAPELPATTLARYCYFYMFENCTSLTQAPELPATTLAGYCYESMFSGCTSLTQAPALPATTMATNCYENMFYGCTNLSEIHVLFDEWIADYYTTGWVKDVAPTGTFICPKDLPLEYGVDRIPEGWTVKYIDGTVAVKTNYLTFTAEEDGSTFGIAYNYLSPDVQYSLNGGETWTELAVGDTILLAKKGDKALIRGYNGGGLGSNKEDYVHFVMTGAIAASGSVMSLIDGVGLSTEISESFCFYRLFSGCTSLTHAPELPAKTLAYYCYDSMFSGCTSLTQAPELPATEMSFYCYNSMFSGCTSLTQAPELPATTLFENCYSGMFSGCTSLTQAPELPAKEFLGKYSYSGMFSGCTSLSEINVSFDDWDKLDATFEWVANVAPTGTFYCPKALPLEYGVDRIPEGWTVKYINYLTFTAEEDGSTFGIVNNGGNNPDIQYSLDGGETWTALAAGDTIMLAHKGDKALLRGDNPEGFSKVDIKYSSFTMTGKIAVSGSVMSLIDGTGVTLVVPAGYCFYSLFKGCTSLTQAPELPATRLADGCYYGMFQGCTSLTQAPELPATTLAYSCYRNMFLGCTSLTQAPELSATTLDDDCYECMFRGCTSLTQAPKLPATTLGWGCYDSMFKGCTSLTQAPALPATTLTYTCYYGMFSGCTSLTQAPELPATTLVSSCYAGMFSGCTSLTQAPKLPATELADFGYFEMFSGCTSLTQAPELPATTLTNECYDRMFFDCTSLSEINVSFATWSVYYRSTAEWVKDVAPTGTFICPKALDLEYGVNRIPEGWTVKYVDEGSGVSSTLSDGITVWTDGLTVHVCGAEGEVSLYDMSGKRAAVSNSADEERALGVPSKGVYVVRTSGGERSVLVR